MLTGCTTLRCGSTRVAPARSPVTSSQTNKVLKGIASTYEPSTINYLQDYNRYITTISTPIGLFGYSIHDYKFGDRLVSRLPLLSIESSTEFIEVIIADHEEVIMIPQSLVNNHIDSILFDACLSVIHFTYIKHGRQYEMFRDLERDSSIKIYFGTIDVTDNCLKYMAKKTHSDSRRFAIYGNTVAAHSSTSVDRHIKSAKMRPIRRVIGYISTEEIQRLKVLYKQYRIQDAPMNFNTVHTIREWYLSLRSGMQQRLHTKYPIYQHSRCIFLITPFVGKARIKAFSNTVATHVPRKLYIIPLVYGDTSSSHITLVVILHETLYYIDSNCVISDYNESIIQMLKTIAVNNGLEFEMPLVNLSILQACEGRLECTKIERSGYCQPWAMFISEILCENSAVLLAGTISIHKLLTQVLHGYRPVLARKIVVDYLYTRIIKMKYFNDI